MEHGNELNEALVKYIRTLHGKYAIALLSNSSSAYLRNELALYDLEKYFKPIVISSEVGPDPKVFEYVLDKLGLHAPECVFVDNNPRHVAAANGLGIHGITHTDVPSLRRNLNQLLPQNL